MSQRYVGTSKQCAHMQLKTLWYQNYPAFITQSLDIFQYNLNTISVIIFKKNYGLECCIQPHNNFSPFRLGDFVSSVFLSFPLQQVSQSNFVQSKFECAE